jgi:hypothetical protein
MGVCGVVEKRQAGILQRAHEYPGFKVNRLRAHHGVEGYSLLEYFASRVPGKRLEI